MKLSARLDAIFKLIPANYSRIWDCCCDHGYLGRSLLEAQICDEIVFLDQVPALIEEITNDLGQVAEYQGRWQATTQDLNSLLLPDAQSQLVVIAGVGGDLTIEFVQSLLQKNPDKPLDFILCPVRQQFRVRKAMQALGLGLKQEKLVKERGRFYEVLYLSTQSDVEVSAVGRDMWHLDDADHQQYLDSLLGHYQRMSQQGNQESKDALAMYQALYE